MIPPQPTRPLERGKLRHADPATTMRHYIDPMDTKVTGRAASGLD